jgi:transposase-like protein
VSENISSTETTINVAATTTTEAKSRTRTCWSEQDKTEYLALFEQSGLSAADFCRQLGISAATFSLWRRTARGEAPPAGVGAPGFAQVCLSGLEQGVRPTQPGSAAASVVIHLPGGTKLEAPVGADVAWLVQLAKTLNGA